MKKISKIILSTLSILLLIPSIANANETITVPGGNPYLGTAGRQTNTMSAQSFITGTGGNTITATVKLARTATTPTTNPRISIQTDNSGTPSGTVLTSEYYNGTLSTLNGSEECIGTSTVTFTTPYELTGATTYWLVVDVPGYSDVNNGYYMCGSRSSVYGNGQFKQGDNGSWTTPGYDAYVVLSLETAEASTSTEATSTPEQIQALSIYTMLLLLSGALGFILSTWIFQQYILS